MSETSETKASTDAELPDERSIEEIIDGLSTHQAYALDAIRYHGGECGTHDITKRTHIPNGSKKYVYDRMIETGLIEHRGNEQWRGEVQQKVYGMTALGWEVSEQIGHKNISEARVDELRNEIEMLQNQNELLEERIDALREDYEQFKEYVGEHL